MMRKYILSGRTRRRWLAACILAASGVAVTTLTVWAPPSGWLMSMHAAMRRIFGWLHDHWLNAPAITAWATMLLIIVGLVPLYIWRRDRASNGARPDETGRNVESDSCLVTDDDNAKIRVVGDIPREPVAFQGRSELLADLNRALQDQRGPAVCTLIGGRGVGKTQLAAAHARRCIADGWPLVAWVVAEDPGQLVAGLADLADAVGVRGPTQDAELAALSVRKWLEDCSKPSLLVFDNAVDPDNIRSWLPRAGRTQTVITSTHASFSLLGASVDIGVFSLQEAVDFLRDRSGRRDEIDANDVASELGFLPLALSQAAWIIRSQGLTFSVYRQRLRTFPIDHAMPRVPGEPYPRGAAEAAILAVIEADTANETGLVHDLADMIAILSPSGVRREVLYKGFSENHPERIDVALGRLIEASLLTVNLDGGIMTMHRLVQRVLRDHEQQEHRLASAVARTVAAFKSIVSEHADGMTGNAALTGVAEHISTLWEVVRNYGYLQDGNGATTKTGFEMLDLRRSTVDLLIGDHELGRACSVGLDILDDHLTLLGPDHALTTRARRCLAHAYISSGRARLAVPLRAQVVADYVKTKGSDNPETLLQVNSLGYAYETAGLVHEAIEAHSANLDASLQINGPDHQTTMYAQVNLASSYRSAVLYDEALALFEKNVADNARAFGHEHLSTLNARGELARMYERVGRADEAIALHEHNIAFLQNQSSTSRQALLWWKRYLALAYQGAGRTNQAVELLRRTFSESQEALGRDHPETLSVQIFLARAYQAAGYFRDAIKLFEQTAARREQMLGPDYPETLNARRNLANAYHAAGNSRKAEALLASVVDDYERSLGSEHPYTKTAQNDLLQMKEHPRSYREHSWRRRIH